MRALRRQHRGQITDTTLEFLDRAFSADEIVEHGQRFLFLPRPPRPPILVGGSAPHALRRAARYGDGWMPVGADPAKLAPQIAELRELFATAAKAPPEIVALASLPLHDRRRAEDHARSLAAAGVTRLVHAWRYGDATEFAHVADLMAATLGPGLS